MPYREVDPEFLNFWRVTADGVGARGRVVCCAVGVHDGVGVVLHAGLTAGQGDCSEQYFK